MSGRHTVALVALGALVVADVVLVGLALRDDEPTPVGGTPVSTGRSTTTKPTSSRTATSAPTTSKRAAAVPLTVVLTALDGDVAWRGQTGTCASGGAELEVSTDGGATWEAREVTGLASVMRVQPGSATGLFAVGASEACEPVLVSSSDAGLTWGAPSPPDEAWSRDPTSETTVLTPLGRKAEPCDGAEVIDLTRATAEAAVALCPKGQVRGTVDSGATWNDVGGVRGGLALAAVTAERALVARAADTDSCTGLEVVQLDQNDDKVLGCVDLGGARVVPGTVALSVVGESGWLLAGDEVYRSGASFAEWAQP